ncbi:MAG: histidine phosphatase family protein [Anaerolineae bacterium]|nr:histidine phosphatase family protein [Anaerolineae bacterium]
MTQKLILVRHSISAPQPDLPQEAWQLTPEGESRCVQLAEEVRPHAPQRIFTSTEAKAQSTGKHLAQALRIPWQTAPDLQETARGDEDYFADKAAFAAAVEKAMRQPQQILFGRETFADAKARFMQQMRTLVQQHPGETLVLVSHGRVLSMVLGELLTRDPFTIWQEMPMPAYVVLEVPS